MSSVDSSYSKSFTNNGVEFKVIPALSSLHRFSISLTILSGFVAWFVSGIPAMLLYWVAQIPIIGVFAYALLIVISFCVTMWASYKWVKAWLLRNQAKVRHAYDVELLINAAGIEIINTKAMLPRDGIHRIVIKNAYDNAIDIPLSTVAVAGSATFVGATMAANALTNSVAMLANHKAKALARVSYQVRVEAGGVAQVVAGGLTEVCAYGLMRDMDAALNS